MKKINIIILKNFLKKVLNEDLSKAFVCGIGQLSHLKMQRINMKKIILKYGGMLAALAMVFTTLTVNSTCTWMTYQEELPETAKKLRKF